MKKGTIVELVEANDMAAPAGSKAVVVGENDDDTVEIKWIGKTEQHNGGYLKKRFIIFSPLGGGKLTLDQRINAEVRRLKNDSD